MSIFLVVSMDDSGKLSAAIKQQFGSDSYKLPGGEWLVSFDGTTKELSERLDLGDEGNGSALVVSINNYWGYADNNLWEWMVVKSKMAA